MAIEYTAVQREVIADSAEVQASTRRLRETVKLALARQRPKYVGTEASALLLREDGTDAAPTALIEDGDLAPMDKVIWLILMKKISRAGGITVLPTHSELAKITNVAARETVSRALAMLRCRRWLSVCQTAWREGGQHRGSAYALHTAPLPIADALYLDRHYASFLTKTTRAGCARLRKAAQDALADLPDRST